MTTRYKCRDCLYFSDEYYFSNDRDGFNWCDWFKKEVNPDAIGCKDLILPANRVVEDG